MSPSAAVAMSPAVIETTNHLASSPNLAAPIVLPQSHKQRVSNPGRAFVRNALLSHLAAMDVDAGVSDSENGFFVADVGEVYRQHLRWKRNLPRVEPFYAVKCNPDPQVVRLLASLGTGFDCASKAEIQQVLSLGVPENKIIYANPCKAASHIKFAANNGVRMMTFDNADELHKIKRLYPGASLLLRILTDDSKSLCQLGLKFGAPLDTTLPLLKLAKELELDIVGVSFHVGSGSWDPSAFVDAVERARCVFDEAASVGYDLKLLDVGGGFGHDNFETIAAVLGPAIDQHFPSTIRVIAEPGRYYVANAFTLAVNIIARRTVANQEGEAGLADKSYMYYVSDGVYGSFNCILFDHQHPVPRVLAHDGRFLYNEARHDSSVRCSVWGPTCDSLDCISEESFLPYALDVGDWLYFEEMGAYTGCAASRFNGFPLSRVQYVNSEKGAEEMMKALSA
ncbi:Ornithine decarboxylase [Saitoella coloradoensis]